MTLPVIYLLLLVSLLYLQFGACTFSRAYSAFVDSETRIRNIASNLRQERVWDLTLEELDQACVPSCVDSLDTHVHNVWDAW